MTEHVSDLRWDQLLAGELAAEAKAEAEAHAATCERCKTRLAELTAEREAFRFRPPLAPARSLRWTMPIAGGLAAAAALVLVLKLRSRDEAEPEVPYVASKGGTVELLLFAGPPERLAPLAVEDRLFGGDLLQAGYSSPIDGFGAVLSLDGAGNASTYVPAVGNEMVLLPSGQRRSFPASTQLDDVLGTERIAVVWCQHPRPLPPLVAELAHTQTLATPEGCAVRVFALTKAAR